MATVLRDESDGFPKVSDFFSSALNELAEVLSGLPKFLGCCREELGRAPRRPEPSDRGPELVIRPLLSQSQIHEREASSSPRCAGPESADSCLIQTNRKAHL